MTKRLVGVFGTLALATSAFTANLAPASEPGLPGGEASDDPTRPTDSPVAEATPSEPATPLAVVGSEPDHPTQAPERPVPTVAPRVEPKATAQPKATPQPKAKAAPARPKPTAAPVRSKATPTVQEARRYALNRIGSSQFSCLDRLWDKESNWNHRATNPSSGAYGIPQSLPGRKMASHGADWRTNPLTQVRWGLSYIENRYGTACAAWQHSQRNNWY